MVEANPTAADTTAAAEETKVATQAAEANGQEEEKKVEEVKQPASTAGSGLPTISSGVTPLPKTLRGQFEYGKSLKEEGNLYFKQRDYANAIKKYARVRAFLKPLIPNSDGQDNS